jgi:hypothetical protein
MRLRPKPEAPSSPERDRSTRHGRLAGTAILAPANRFFYTDPLRAAWHAKHLAKSDLPGPFG